MNSQNNEVTNIAQMQQSLEDLGIFQLRNLARQVGVPVPTTLKRAELIENILAIASGKSQPKFRKDKKGRPAKYPADISLLSTISNKKPNSFLEYDGFNAISQPAIASFEAVKTSGNRKEKGVEITGYVRVSKDGYALLFEIPRKSRSEFYYIKRQIVLDYGLNDGDKVVAYVLLEQDEPIVSEILAINDVNIKDIKSPYDFDSANREKNNICLFNSNDNLTSFYNNLMPMYCGDKCLVSILDKQMLYLSSIDFIKKVCESENLTDIVVLGVNCALEVIEEVAKLPKVSAILGSFGEENDYQKSLVQIALKNVLNLASIENRKVMFIVLNMQQVLSVFNEQEQESLLNYFKKTFSYAKQTDKSSLTIAYIVDSVDMLDNFMPNQNILLEYLPLKYLTKSEIKYNLVNSFRQEIVFDNVQRLCLRQAVVNFLSKKEDDYAALALIVQKNKDIQGLINDLEN